MKRVIGILGGLVALTVAGYGIAEYLVNRELKRNFDKELAGLEEHAVITYDRFHYSLITRQAKAHGITATATDGSLRVLIEGLIVHRMERDDALDIITALRLSGHGVRLRQKQGDDYVPALTGLGYNDPRLDFLLDHSYDPAKEMLTLNECNVTGEEMGSLDLKSQLSGLRKIDTSDLSGGNILQIAMAIGNLQFHGATVDYTDQGLAERILARREADEKTTRSKIVKETAKSMRQQKFFRFSEEMIQEVSAFLEKPDTLQIQSAPSQPVGRELIGMTLLFRGNLLQVFGVTIRNGAAG